MQLCICARVIPDGLVAVEIDWVMGCTFICLVSFSLPLSDSVNGKANIHTHGVRRVDESDVHPTKHNKRSKHPE